MYKCLNIMSPHKRLCQCQMTTTIDIEQHLVSSYVLAHGKHVLIIEAITREQHLVPSNVNGLLQPIASTNVEVERLEGLVCIIKQLLALSIGFLFFFLRTQKLT